MKIFYRLKHDVKLLNSLELEYSVYNNWNKVSLDKSYWKLLQDSRNIFEKYMIKGNGEEKRDAIRSALMLQKRISLEEKEARSIRLSMGLPFSIPLFMGFFFFMFDELMDFDFLSNVSTVELAVVFLSVSLISISPYIWVLISLRPTRDGAYLQFIDDCIEIIDKITSENEFGLSDDQQIFCNKYLQGFQLNAIEAAKTVGEKYGNYEVATMYLLNPNCQRYLNNKLSQQRTK